MTIQKFQSLDLRNGAFQKVSYKTNGKNGGFKITKGVFRFLDHSDPRYTKACKFVNQTSKSQIVYLWLTKNFKHKVMVSYYDNNGVEITKDDFENINGATSNNIVDVFSKRLDDIISIG